LAENIGCGVVILRRGGEELVLDILANLVMEIHVEDEDKKS